MLTVLSALALAIGIACPADAWVSSAVRSALIAVLAVPVLLAVELGCTWVAERGS